MYNTVTLVQQSMPKANVYGNVISKPSIEIFVFNLKMNLILAHMVFTLQTVLLLAILYLKTTPTTFAHFLGVKISWKFFFLKKEMKNANIFQLIFRHYSDALLFAPSVASTLETFNEFATI